MFDGNITRPNITNGAQSKERNTTKKDTKSAGNASGTGSFSQMLHDFANKVREAEAAEAKSQKSADSVVDKFIGNLRSADSNTQKKIVERLKGQSLDEILRPDITNDAHSVERNGSGNPVPFYDALLKAFGNGGAWRQVMDSLWKGGAKGKNEESVIDEYGNYKLSDGKGVLSVNAEALAEENANNASRQNMDAGRNVMLPAKKTLVYTGNGRPGGPRTTIPDDAEDVEYTYQTGDTFAQFLLNSGLSDGSNLWGPNGDVEYYRKQLAEQGYTGNIPVGTTIRLKKRK